MKNYNSGIILLLVGLLLTTGCEFITTDDFREVSRDDAILIGSTGNLRSSLMAVEEINLSGITRTLFNKEVRLINGNQQVLLDEGVDVIIGPGSSGAVVNFIPILTDPASNPRRIACISPSATNPFLGALPDSGLFWRTILSDAFQGAALATEAANKRGLKTSAILYANTPYGEGFAESFAENFQRYGGTIRGNVPFDETNTEFDFNTIMPQLFEGRPEVIFFIITSSALAVRFSEQAISGGFINDDYRPLILTGDAAFSQAFIQGANRSFLNGMIISTPDADRSTDLYKSFERRYEQKYFVSGSSISGYEIAAFDAVMIASLAMVAANSDDPKVFVPFFKEVSDGTGLVVTRENLQEGIAALRAGQKINYEGVSGPCDFKENGDITNGSYALYVIEDGSPTLSGFVTIE